MYVKCCFRRVFLLCRSNVFTRQVFQTIHDQFLTNLSQVFAFQAYTCNKCSLISARLEQVVAQHATIRISPNLSGALWRGYDTKGRRDRKRFHHCWCPLDASYHITRHRTGPAPALLLGNCRPAPGNCESSYSSLGPGGNVYWNTVPQPKLKQPVPPPLRRRTIERVHACDYWRRRLRPFVPPV